eukprot:CAMPEP_0206293680 /NCGR_PEP_ID=MMETSP0106_2-20121207/4262_1 /ASSEMBLY_ACC=CAM_ASM_000206 /TAXON_ID=81532 /ORGANISM="Acanthoeca-like sp., Strain 10tr" /LENGTH=186 /DNA_ID=CAMNT_0053724283 /DNA_START=76 /DNA_END=633 /DNA_ORIENTATION=-
MRMCVLGPKPLHLGVRVHVGEESLASLARTVRHYPDWGKSRGPDSPDSIGVVYHHACRHHQPGAQDPPGRSLNPLGSCVPCGVIVTLRCAVASDRRQIGAGGPPLPHRVPILPGAIPRVGVTPSPHAVRARGKCAVSPRALCNVGNRRTSLNRDFAVALGAHPLRHAHAWNFGGTLLAIGGHSHRD